LLFSFHNIIITTKLVMAGSNNFASLSAAASGATPLCASGRQCMMKTCPVLLQSPSYSCSTSSSGESNGGQAAEERSNSSIPAGGDWWHALDYFVGLHWLEAETATTTAIAAATFGGKGYSPLCEEGDTPEAGAGPSELGLSSRSLALSTVISNLARLLYYGS
jgi:hypothetical protein